MRKVLTIIVISAVMMVACHAKTLHFEKAKKTPKNFTEALTGNLNYQLIDDGNDGNYIVVNASVDVEATMDTEGTMVNLRFDNGSGPKQQHIYYLTTGEDHDTINLIIDGEETAFDVRRNIPDN